MRMCRPKPASVGQRDGGGEAEWGEMKRGEAGGENERKEVGDGDEGD